MTEMEFDDLKTKISKLDKDQQKQLHDFIVEILGPYPKEGK